MAAGIAAGALVAGTVLLPAAAGIAAVWPGRDGVGPPPAGFQGVDLKTPDGVDLSAWYHPPENGATILLLHGAGNSRESARDHASLLRSHGFGVLALDLRGHGESGGRTNRLGWAGTGDVLAAIQFIREQTPVGPLGGLGLSMGGEVLLGATSICPEIQAMVVEGATFRSAGEMAALPVKGGLFRTFPVQVRDAVVRLLTSQAPPTPLMDAMAAAPATRFLLIAAGDEGSEIAFNRRFAAKVGGRAGLWVVEGSGHTRGLEIAPAEYEERVITFLSQNLLNRTRWASPLRQAPDSVATFPNP
jgi:pimeloyl-ACP methyl ester carboxylesterase